jgi:carbon-monoxide dehydrogenase small subunit
MNGKPVHSCIVLARKAEGAEILTIEGLAGKDGGLHPVQEAFVEAGAVQCGFCTPGLVLKTYNLLSRKSDASDEDIREALKGHLCRCTGYEAILEGARLAREKMKSAGSA